MTRDSREAMPISSTRRFAFRYAGLDDAKRAANAHERQRKQHQRRKTACRHRRAERRKSLDALSRAPRRHGKPCLVQKARQSAEAGVIDAYRAGLATYSNVAAHGEGIETSKR